MSQGKLTAALLFAVVPTVFATACVEEELDVGTTAQALNKCGSWGCDSNSPVIDVWEFHELNENGLANDANVRMTRLIQGSQAYRVDVSGAKLTAYPYSPGIPVLQGPALIGSYMEVVDENDKIYRIYIKNVSNVVKYWVGSTIVPVETYELVYTDKTSMIETRALCKNSPGRLDGEGQFWLKPVEAILFAGDRYDADSLEVTETSDSGRGWFNIGCAGGALAKLFLTRHTDASKDSTHWSGWEQRQAMLKMYTADVCGAGIPTTKQGEPLHWQNKYNWMKLTGTEASFEAVWDENGALCLDEHRLQSNALLWPDIWNDMVAACGGVAKVPKPCSVVFPGGVSTFPGGSYLLTANP